MPERVSGPPPSMLPRRSTLEPRGSFLLAGAALQALDGARARFGAPPLDAARRSTLEPRGSFLLAGAALQALDGARARFGAPPQHFRASDFRLWTVRERVSGPPPFDAARRSTFEPRGSFLLAGAALQALDGTRARFGAPPPSMLPGAALSSLAARFCWEAQHFGASRLVSAGRGSTSGSGRCPSAFRAPPPRCCQAQHFRASRLVSAGRGSTSGSGRCPSAFRGPPPSMLPALWSLAARFCWQGQHFRLWTVPERVSAALLSLAARFCWQGQHFRLWTVPERVSGPPPRCCQAQHFRASRLVSASRGSTSGSGRCPSAFRGPPASMLPGAALSSLA